MGIKHVCTGSDVGITRSRKPPFAKMAVLAGALIALSASAPANSQAGKIIRGEMLAHADDEKYRNPFGFIKNEKVQNPKKHLEAFGIRPEEMMIKVHPETQVSTVLIISEKVKAIYCFDRENRYCGLLMDLAAQQDLNISNAKNWVFELSYTNSVFLTAENLFWKRMDGSWVPAMVILGVDPIIKNIVTAIKNLSQHAKEEGGFLKPRLARHEEYVLLHAFDSNGKPWENIYAFEGSRGELKGIYHASPAFIKQLFGESAQ